MWLLDRYWSTACCRGERDGAKPVGRGAVALTAGEPSAGYLDDSNVYLTWMRRGIEAGVIDPGLREMLDDKEKLHWIVSLRLSQFGDALRHRDAGYLRGVPIAFNSTPFHPNLDGLNFKVLALSDSDELLCVPRMDGHHRLFVLKLLGIERCRMMTIWDPETLSRATSLARVELRAAHVSVSRRSRCRRSGRGPTLRRSGGAPPATDPGRGGCDDATYPRRADRPVARPGVGWARAGGRGAPVASRLPRRRSEPCA